MDGGALLNIFEELSATHIIRGRAPASGCRKIWNARKDYMDLWGGNEETSENGKIVAFLDTNAVAWEMFTLINRDN